MKISFAITTHNEGECIQHLLDQLIPYCESTGDEIVILDDQSDDPVTMRVLGLAKSQSTLVQLSFRPLDGNFAAQKNYLNSLCTGDYIFQIDADETLNEKLLTYLHDIVENNTNVDLFIIPRVNIVNGLTDDDIKRWGWKVNDKGWVMFPDYQTRLYRNADYIKWEGKVHERIVGYKTMAPLPDEEEWCLYHIKEIERQRKQNDYYQTLQR